MISQPTPSDIRKRKNAARLTQQQCADLVYVEKRSWQYWESGERNMPLNAWELFLIKTQPLVDAELQRIEKVKRERQENEGQVQDLDD